MGGFFDMEGPFARFGNMLADIMILGILWIVCSIPIITVGASTTALFYVTTRRISNKEGYILRDFFKSFRQNFKVSTVIWIVFIAASIIISMNIRSADLLGGFKPFILPIQICFAAELFMMSIFAFPIVSRFELGIVDTLKNAFLMANKHLPTTFLCFIIMLGVAAVSYITIIFTIIAMSVYAFLTSYLLMRVFKKYRPEMDE